MSAVSNGFGGESNSFNTASGLLRIADKNGEEAVSGLLFSSRLAQPPCATIESNPVSTGFDTMTSRTLRLHGVELGINKGGICDACKYIYRRGTAEEGLLA